MKTTVGIIGYGSFGKFMADKFSGPCEVKIYSRRMPPDGGLFVNFEEVAKVDYLILSIPLNAYEDYLKRAKPLLRKQTVIIDVCSVKLEPLKLIKSILPGQPVVATHPLFGPETASQSLEGHTMVICPEQSDPAQTKVIAKLAKAAGLKVLLIPADEHDKEMARIHALTFFIARVLDGLNLESFPLDTPSYKRLLHLAELDKHHSPELFDTIQSGNPYAKAMRAKFMGLATKLNSKLD